MGMCSAQLAPPAAHAVVVTLFIQRASPSMSPQAGNHPQLQVQTHPWGQKPYKSWGKEPLSLQTDQLSRSELRGVYYTCCYRYIALRLLAILPASGTVPSSVSTGLQLRLTTPPPTLHYWQQLGATTQAFIFIEHFRLAVLATSISHCHYSISKTQFPFIALCILCFLLLQVLRPLDACMRFPAFKQ